MLPGVFEGLKGVAWWSLLGNRTAEAPETPTGLRPTLSANNYPGTSYWLIRYTQKEYTVCISFLVPQVVGSTNPWIQTVSVSGSAW